ncbi:MAG: heavy metal-associated domain-containing protein [Bacteroidia bacterium]
MKSIYQFLFGCAIFAFSLSACSATKSGGGKFQQARFAVKGICKMCEERIEEAALVRGVQTAEWNINTDTLTIRYNPAIITEMEIQQKVADAGHDTQDIKASSEKYEELPLCCRYHELEKH